MQSSNVKRHPNSISPTERMKALGQKGLVVWLTGLSGSGKSTVAMALERELVSQGRFCTVLDGDNLRHGLCGDLGFSESDRTEDIRRVGEVARLFQTAGVITLCSFVSPSRSVRDELRTSFPEDCFLEVYLSTGLEVCEARDPKGLYVRARRGDIQEFTGISSPYEAPLNPHLSLDTSEVSLEECVRLLMGLIDAT